MTGETIPLDPEKSREVVRRCWDGNADRWASEVRAGHDRHREMLNNPAFFDHFLPDLSGRTVLDAGCGEGYNTRLMARRGMRLTGIDISPRMIELAREAEARERLGIDYRVGSFIDLIELRDGSFDAVVSTMALMDSPGFDRAARAIHRVLKPGGTLWFSVLHPCFVTPGFRWITDEDGDEEGLLVAHYFAETGFIERWRFKEAMSDDAPPFTVPSFPHRLSDYFNGLVDAGFSLLRVAEPRPSPEMVARQPWLARLRRHAPLFLHIGAAKA